MRLQFVLNPPPVRPQMGRALIAATGCEHSVLSTAAVGLSSSYGPCSSYLLSRIDLLSAHDVLQSKNEEEGASAPIGRRRGVAGVLELLRRHRPQSMAAV